MSIAAWTIATLANGAAITLTAQPSALESVGFECSAKGLTFLAKLESAGQKTGNSQNLELEIAGVNIALSVVYMLETKPRFWSGDLIDPMKAMGLLAISELAKITIPERTLVIELDKMKSAEFVAACNNLFVNIPQ